MALNVEYNTGRDKLLLSEYGRSIQKMVQYAIEEGNRDKRNRLAQSLITLMGNMNPHLRDVADYKHKLWDHLFIISDFKLDVDSPYPKPTPETVHSRPDPVPYPQSRIRFRFYGKNIVEMIKKASEMEDGPVRLGFINLIGSFMKNACKNFNEEMLADEEIMAHLELLSEGRIRMTNDDNVQFNALQQPGGQPYPNNNNNNNQRRNNNQRNGGNNNRQGGQGNNNRNFRNGGGNNNNRNNNNRNFRNNNNNNNRNNRGN